MNSVEKNQLVVKIHAEDWIEDIPQSLSINAKEVLLTVNCYLYFSKVDPKDWYWSEIDIHAFKELTALNDSQINDAFKELIDKKILQQSDNIITFNRKAEYYAKNPRKMKHEQN